VGMYFFVFFVVIVRGIPTLDRYFKTIVSCILLQKAPAICFSSIIYESHCCMICFFLHICLLTYNPYVATRRHMKYFLLHTYLRVAYSRLFRITWNLAARFFRHVAYSHLFRVT